MKKFIFFILQFLWVCVRSSSCYYDKEELLYGTPNAPCTDTTSTVSYAQQVVPMFQQYCYSCHSGSFPSGNTMGTYATDKAIAQNGKLYGSVNHCSRLFPYAGRNVQNEQLPDRHHQKMD